MNLRCSGINFTLRIEISVDTILGNLPSINFNGCQFNDSMTFIWVYPRGFCIQNDFAHDGIFLL